MNKDHKYYIPRYLDEPMRIIIFTVDELIIFLTVLGFGYFFIHEIVGVVAAVAVHIAYMNFKHRESSAFVKRTAYWNGFSQLLKVLPFAKTDKYKG